jgi:hypothetical protein
MKTFFAFAFASAMLSAGAYAQPPVPAAKPNVIHARKVNQQKRIAQGVKSGQLTAGETARLEHREANLNKTIRTERAANGGKLTPAERRQVAGRQNRLSRDIHKQKHDAQHQ